MNSVRPVVGDLSIDQVDYILCMFSNVYKIKKPSITLH